SHNAGTFQPYDPSEVMGETQPTTPKPPKKAKCGAFGQVLSIVVAVVASYYLGPLLGNLVSQGFNNLIGTQSGFSWKSLAMAQVSAGVTMGLDGAFAGIQSSFLQGAAQAAAASAITQGIGVATGLQKKFDFAGVAAAGVAGGISSWASARLDGRSFDPATGWQNGASTAGSAALAHTAGAIAGAVTRSVLNGNSFGDNLLASLPEVIGRAAVRGMGGGNILTRLFADKEGPETGSAAPMAVEQTEGNEYAELAKLDPLTQGQLEAEADANTITVTGTRYASLSVSLDDQAAVGALVGRAIALDRLTKLSQGGEALSVRLAGASASERKAILRSIGGGTNDAGTSTSGGDTIAGTKHLAGGTTSLSGRQWLGAMIESAYTEGVTDAELSDYFDQHINLLKGASDMRTAIGANFVDSANDTQLAYGIPVLERIAGAGNSNAQIALELANAGKRQRYDDIGAKVNAALWQDAKDFGLIYAGTALVVGGLAAPGLAAGIAARGTPLFYRTTMAIGAGTGIGLTEVSYQLDRDPMKERQWGDYVTAGGFGVLAGSGWQPIGKFAPNVLGWSEKYLVSAANGALFAGGADVAGQFVNVALDPSVELNWYKTLRMGALGAGAGLVLPRISGVNAGRNNYESVYNAQLGRLNNGYIGNISPWVTMRGAAANQATPVTQGVVATTGEIVYKRMSGQ
ncbi:hypothetical protein, partial [Sphingorhabdus sp.]|uniref:hypothetical protein n=1 Tax=Sphingorhabdus sp. TaxID=1902408 RepID=UPI0032B74624